MILYEINFYAFGFSIRLNSFNKRFTMNFAAVVMTEGCWMTSKLTHTCACQLHNDIVIKHEKNKPKLGIVNRFTINVRPLSSARNTNRQNVLRLTRVSIVDVAQTTTAAEETAISDINYWWRSLFTSLRRIIKNFAQT